jgi:hypothetical protein
VDPRQRRAPEAQAEGRAGEGWSTPASAGAMAPAGGGRRRQDWRPLSGRSREGGRLWQPPIGSPLCGPPFVRTGETRQGKQGRARPWEGASLRPWWALDPARPGRGPCGGRHRHAPSSCRRHAFGVTGGSGAAGPVARAKGWAGCLTWRAAARSMISLGGSSPSPPPPGVTPSPPPPPRWHSRW